MNQIITSAPGNVFFFGEHFVVYGEPAIISSIDLRTYVSIEKPLMTDNDIKISSEGYGELLCQLRNNGLRLLHMDEELKPAYQLLNNCRLIFRIDQGADIKISSQIPKESGGMSSSTAFLSSLFHALNLYYGWGLKKEEYFDHLYPIQRYIHGGAASGAELISSILGGINTVFKKEVSNKNGMPISFKPLNATQFYILIADTGREAKTKITVSQVRKLYECDPKAYARLFREYRELFLKARAAIEARDAGLVGTLMNENQELLEKLDRINREVNEVESIYHNMVDIVSEELKELSKVAVNAGAYGAKLSGGGAGGIMVVLLDPERKPEVVGSMERKAEELGLDRFKVREASLGVEGVKLEHIQPHAS